MSELSPLRETYEDDEAGGKEEGPSRVEVEAVNEDMLAEKPKVEKPAVLPATVHGLADVSQIEMCSGKGCRMSRAQVSKEHMIQVGRRHHLCPQSAVVPFSRVWLRRSLQSL